MSRSNTQAGYRGGSILLSQLSHELADLESALSGVQEAVSELVELSAPEPDMVRRLQKLDTITQTTENLARVLDAMAQCHPAVPDEESIRAEVGMKDIGDRLANAVAGSSVAPPAGRPSASTNQGDVSWL